MMKKEYKGILEVLSAVRREILSLQPIDSDTVVWERTLNGMFAHVVDVPHGGGGGNQVVQQGNSKPPVEGYNGYFTIKDVSTYKGKDTIYTIRVVDGNTYRRINEPPYWASGNSIASVEGTAISIPAIEFTNILSKPDPWGKYEVYVFISPGTRYYASLMIGTYADYNRIKGSYLIGTVSLVDGVLKIHQQHTSGIASMPVYYRGGGYNPVIRYGFYYGPLAICPTLNQSGYRITDGTATVPQGYSIIKLYHQSYDPQPEDTADIEVLDASFSGDGAYYLCATFDYTNLKNSKVKIASKHLPKSDYILEIGSVSNGSIRNNYTTMGDVVSIQVDKPSMIDFKADNCSDVTQPIVRVNGGTAKCGGNKFIIESMEIIATKEYTKIVLPYIYDVVAGTMQVGPYCEEEQIPEGWYYEDIAQIHLGSNGRISNIHNYEFTGNLQLYVKCGELVTEGGANA